MAATPLLALPWYLGILGPKQFGLIGVMITIQTLLGLLDSGMSQALVREISVRLGAERDPKHQAAELLFGFERIYWVAAFLLSLFTAFLSTLISRYWLNLNGLQVSVGEEAVLGAAALFAVQFPGSIYRSMMVAGQVQVTLNIIMSSFVLLRHLGAVVLLLFFPAISTYILWFFVVGLTETMIRRYFAWRCLSMVQRPRRWSMSVLKENWGIVAGMSVATWVGALTLQMDKIVLSRMAPIEQFGYYMIAASVSGGVLQMIYPLVQAVLPRAVQLRDDTSALYALNIRLFIGIALVVLTGVMVFVFAGRWLLSLWLADAEAVNVVFPLLAALLVGTALNAFYNVGYVNWIALDKIRRVMQVNLTAFLLSLMIMPFLVSLYGVVGAAFGWIVINSIGLILSLEWLKRVET